METIDQLQHGSRAFQEAVLRSEQKRILVVIGFTVVFTVVAAVRVFVYGSAMHRWGFLFAFAFVLYELGMMRVVRTSLKFEKQLPISLWLLNVIIEMLFPAVGTAFFISSRLEPAYRPLATPWVLIFFPFLIVSTLRLSPLVCQLGGVVSGLAYLIAAYNLGWRPALGSSSATVTQTAVPFYAIILVASGFVAAAVATEIRKHVEAALHEAETQRKLEQVQHDLKIARSIQQSLLPSVRPTIDGFQIAGWNRSADSTGGDYFDWRQLEDGRLVVSLADVTGHGIGPALLASVCRAYARASFARYDNLATTLQRINRSLGDDLTPGRFATFVAAVCKGGDSQIELLSAGHGPLFVYSNSTNSFREISAQAIPLGLMPDLNAGDPLTLSLEPGDLLLLITDGFFEWENAFGEQFGSERLAAAVRKAKHLPPEEIIASLYQAVLDFADGSPQQDDLTAVVIKRATTC
jgi:serine phosphatase RsbU (regulator of sigma subunit)